MRTQVLRRIAAAGIAAGVVVALTGCGGGGGARDENTIVWWHNGTSGDLGDLWNTVAQEFQDAHPGITVQVQAFQNEELQNTILPNAFAGGNPPDLFQSWGGGQLVSWVDEGRVKDITDATADTAATIGGTVAGWQVGGKTYGLPYTFGASGLWYNKDVFADAGITTLPATIDELKDTVATLRSAGVSPIALGGNDSWPAAHWWYQFAVKSCSVAALTAASEQHDFSDDCWVEAGEHLQDFISIDPFNAGWQGTSAQQGAGSSAGLVATGQAGMELMGSWNASVMAGILNDAGVGDGSNTPENIGWFPFPEVDPAGETSILGGGDGFSVGADAPDAAVELLNYILSPEVQERYVKTGFLPAVGSASSALDYQPLIDNAEAVASADHVQLWLDTAFGPEISTPMNNAIVAFMQGQGTPQDVVDAIRAAAS